MKFGRNIQNNLESSLYTSVFKVVCFQRHSVVHSVYEISQSLHNLCVEP